MDEAEPAWCQRWLEAPIGVQLECDTEEPSPDRRESHARQYQGGDSDFAMIGKTSRNPEQTEAPRLQLVLREMAAQKKWYAGDLNAEMQGSSRTRPPQGGRNYPHRRLAFT